MMRITPMVKNILLINLIIFIVQSILSLPFEFLFGLRVIFARDFAPYQFLTYMWIHGNFSHIFGNMIMLFFMGTMLERVWGPKRFLIFYLVCGIGAGVLFGLADFIEKYPLKTDSQTYLSDPNPERFKIFVSDYSNILTDEYKYQLDEFGDEYYENPNDQAHREKSISYVSQLYELSVNGGMVGASGAIYGLLMAVFLLFPNTYVYIYFLFPVKLKYVVFALTIGEIYWEMNRSPGDNVAHLAHLGGMLIAFIVIKIWQKNKSRFY